MKRRYPKKSPSAAQITIEFLTIMIFAILLLTMMMSLVAYHLSNSSSEALQEGVEDVVDTVDVELTTARAIGDGYATNFTLPRRVQGLVYTIELSTADNESVVAVSAGGAYADKRVPECTGSLSPGANTIRALGGELFCEGEE